LQRGVEREFPLCTTLLQYFYAGVPGSFHRHVSPRPCFGGLAAGGVLAGGFPRVLFSPCGVLFPPLWCFPPRCAGAVPPCGLLTRSVASCIMGPTGRPSGVVEPDVGWQAGGRRRRAAAARISTTPTETAETLADAQASHRHAPWGCGGRTPGGRCPKAEGGHLFIDFRPFWRPRDRVSTCSQSSCFACAE